MRDINSNVVTARHGHQGLTVQTTESVQSIWRVADAVCFDVDSTVCQDEAIDELANFCGVGEQVAEWTKKAMNGGWSFREALVARLQLIKPSIYEVEDYIHKQPPQLTPGIRELVAELHRRSVAVYLVSGGFARIILPVARLLNIPDENVYANVLQFDEEGNYAGFDLTEPTSDSGGKGVVCGLLKARYGYKNLVMVGDGTTDLEACPPADAFIGFGGNHVREKVQQSAKWFVSNFAELLAELSNN